MSAGFAHTHESESVWMLRSTMRRFVDREVRPLVVEAERAEQLPDELVAKVKQLGVLGGVIPARYGGGGLS
jgi:alkylation response protein AidB-like acyl-CoA dehydrogenase